MHDTLSAPLLRARFKATGRLGLASAITAIVLCIDVAWLLLAGWSVSGRGVAVLMLGVAACLAPLAIRRYRRDIRICTTMPFCALLVYPVRRTSVVLPVFAGLDLAMLASTPNVDGHYLVDVLAGSALALMLIGLSRERSIQPAAVRAASINGLEALHP